MKFRRTFSLIAGVTLLTLITSGCGSTQTSTKQVKNMNYPEKTIKIINYVPAGAGPDVVNREVADLLHKQQKGWNFEITNVPGVYGSEAANQVLDAPHDGYTLLGQSENMLGFSVYGYTKHTAKDWRYYEVLQETSVLAVSADSPYRTVQDLINAAKANPGKLKLASTGVGRSFYIKSKMIEKVTGAQFNQEKQFIGAVGASDALINGSVDALNIPKSEVIKKINEGKIRPLAITDLNSFNFGGKFGLVESITKYYPETKKYLPIDGVIGLSMPADVPKDVSDAFGKAFDSVMKSDEMQGFVDKRGDLKLGLWGDDANKYMLDMESNYTWLAKEFGLTKVDPETLGIKKPR